MKAPLLAALLLAGCAAAPPPQPRTLPLEALTRQIVAGATTRAQALALAEPERRIVFDSGYEAWLYHYPAPPGIGEYVVLFAPSGIASKTRSAVIPPNAADRR